MSPKLVPQPIYSTPLASRREAVLWVSRHQPLLAQIRKLEEKLGPIIIHQINAVVPSADEIVKVAEQVGAKIIVPVLPLSMIARLAELAPRKGLTILFAKMEAIAQLPPADAHRLQAEAPEKRTVTTYADGLAKVHEFRGFEKIVKVQIVTEPWG